MDEILINEKKYISSKQAAKLTGYAKDYVGQLCREGRVPARLVGRSWYVLESAIQDHRFGTPEAEEKPKNTSKKASQRLDWVNESPRYEAAPVELLPPIRRPQAEIEKKPALAEPESLQNAWKSWFDRVGNAITPNAQESEPEPEIKPQEAPEEQVIEEMAEDEEVNIPIHTIYQMPPKELLPRYAPKLAEEELEQAEEPIVTERHRTNRGVVATVRVIAIVIALTAGSIAAIGSGYLDKFIVTNGYSNIISGINVYNK